MKQYINLGGKERPILFGFAGLYQYEQGTGRKALADFAQLQEGEMSVTTIVDLTYHGLIAGARSSNQNVDFSPFDVAEWIGEPGMIEKVMTIFAQSFEQAEGGNAKPEALIVATPPAK